LKRKKPTQFDVAHLAGVSQTTVSLVLNNPETPSVPQETRDKVQAAIRSLSYLPNNAARVLRTLKTNTLATIIPDITNPYYPTFVRGIQDTAERNGFDLVVYNTDGELEREKRSLLSIRRNQVDGVIAALFHLSAVDLAGLEIPAVNFQLKPVEPTPIDVIYIDNVGAARSIVSYLIERGFDCIGLIAEVEDTPPWHSRILGYKQALAEHHIPLQENLIRLGKHNEAVGYQGMKELLKLSPRPRAVFAANDLMAMDAMIAVREAGLRIPADMAIVGFDDIPAAKMVNPPLTTVNQFQDQIGRRATETLLERINGSAPQEMRAIEMPYQLIIRQSA